MRIVRVFGLVCSMALAAGQGWAQTTPGMPRLQKQGTATQLTVDGKPFLALTGELGNNAATSVEHTKSIWPRLKAANLNTALVGVSWAQIEPVEGKFDFSVLDGVIQQARQQNMHMVLLWFASWKNGFSSYPPDWVKKDFERFPLMQINKGKSIAMLSPFSAANRDADAKAFAALMRHVRETDGQNHTVVMIQVENEVGVLRDSRDRSPAANKAFAGPVPKELMDYLQKHKDTLISEFAEVWKAHGSKTSGTWEEVFGPGKPDSLELAVRTLAPPMTQEEKDAAWHKLTWPVDEILHGLAVRALRRQGGRGGQGGIRHSDVRQRLAAATGPRLARHLSERRSAAPGDGHLESGRSGHRFPGAGSVPDPGPDRALHALHPPGQPAVHPRNRRRRRGPRQRAVCHGAIRRHRLLAVRNRAPGQRPHSPAAGSTSQIANMAPIILEHQGTGTMAAARFTEEEASQKIKLGNYTAEISVARNRRSGPQAPTLPATAILISTGPDEYFIVGNSLNVTFSPNGPGPEQVGLGTVEEGSVRGRQMGSRQAPGGRRHRTGCDLVRPRERRVAGDLVPVPVRPDLAQNRHGVSGFGV